MNVRDYVIFKFYISSYGMQSPPIVIPASEVEENGWRWGLQHARAIFLRDYLRHKGQGETIHPSHQRLWRDGKITYEAKLKSLAPEQLSALRGLGMPRTRMTKKIHASSRRKVGWKRRYGQ
jgi:hypothetical protein